MIDIKKALKIIEKETGSLKNEKEPLTSSVGRILAEDIVADTDLPPFDRSQMDGYAVRAADTVNAPTKLRVVGESAAGRGWPKTLKPGQAIRIMTGAPVPAGADAMQKVELTHEHDDIVEIRESVKIENNIVRRGAEIKRGTAVFGSGKMITENMIATLASFGYAKVKVGKRPRISILGTGSEIVDISKKPGRDQIRNSNSVMLDVLCRRFGGQTTILPIVRDEISDLKFQILDAAKRSNVLIITGGVSVGKYDHTKAALSELGAEIFFEKVRLKPGKPTVFARLHGSLVFGLPGNPVSATTAFYLFVADAIRKMQGGTEKVLAKGTAISAGLIKGTKERDSYLPCTLSYQKDGLAVITPLRGLGSSDFVTFAAADCLAVIPRGTNVETGSSVSFLTLPQR
ncbi:MAG: gephyrin-like molybdotransferase Glp [Pyrinomonadaceae bacterium]